MNEMKRIVGLFRFKIEKIRMFSNVFMGGDGRRILKEMEFLNEKIDE